MSAKGVILVVDDTAESLLMLTSTLRTEGYEVRPADGGELALASVTARKPELILLDIRMPGMDGYEVCRRLKASEDSRNIPVVFLSANNSPDDRVEGLRMGAVDYVSKPFCKEELLARIETHLELSRLRLELTRRVAERTAQLRAANERLKVELAERTRAEHELRESEARFRSVADTASVIIWTTRFDMEIEFVNHYAVAFTGRPSSQLTGQGWKDVVHPEDLDRVVAESLACFESRRHYQSEFRVRRADGEYRWMLETATPRFLPAGDFAGYMGVMTDITEMKRNQDRLLAAQKLESLGALVAGVAHNLNNQMGTILSEADLAMSDLPRESPVYGNVERISAVTMRVSGIVALLMSYAGSGSTAAVPINLAHVVEETLRLLKATTSKLITFDIEFANNLPPIEADMSRIRQLVVNLVTNAAESLGNQAGSIRVATSKRQVGQANRASESAQLEPGEYVCLQVADTGCGIPDEARSKIFDPFYSTKSLGRGLGLAAVLGIVRSLGGSVVVDSAVGRGSTFTVLIPSRGSG